MSKTNSTEITQTPHLSNIATCWTMVRNASAPDKSACRTAQEQLLNVYSNSIRRYLIASLRDEVAADEVFQNFALKLVRGDFASADPEFGKFRSFVKTVLYRLMMDYHRDRKRNGRFNEIASDPTDDRFDSISKTADADFQRHWREGLLNFAWKQLQLHQEQQGGMYYSLLRTKAQFPDLTNDELLSTVATDTGKQLSSGSLRVTLHRARQKFSDFLLEALASSIQNPTDAVLEDELIALDLKKYKVCNDAMNRKRAV